MPRLQPGEDPNSNEKRLEIAQRRAKVIELVGQSRTYRQIAKELGISIGTVTSDFHEALKEIPRASVEDLREQEDQRLQWLLEKTLEMLENPVNPQTSGDGKSILGIQITNPAQAMAELRKISESRRKLHGLDAPVEISGSLSVDYTINGVNPEDVS